MVRPRKDQQAPVSAPGQQYGQNQDQIQAQHVIPLPDNTVRPDASGGNAAAVAGHAPVAPQDPMAAALAAARTMPPPGPPLDAPSTRPGEDISVGGSIPGMPRPGPSRARAQSVADTYEMLADATGDRSYRTLANIARQQVL